MNPFLSSEVQRDMVLASRSPRRIKLMSDIGLEFRVVPADISLGEARPDCPPQQIPLFLARKKAEKVSLSNPASLVIGADTMVFIDAHILEKPKDDDQAKEFLARLSGREHIVTTGLAIVRRKDGLLVEGSESTRVLFRDLSEREIETYVSTREGKDKAGSYAIQGLGSCLVRAIHGCFYNVVGLPIALLIDLLRRCAP